MTQDHLVEDIRFPSSTEKMAHAIVHDAEPFLSDHRAKLEDTMLELGLYAMIPKNFRGDDHTPPPPAHPNPEKFDSLFSAAFNDAANVTSALKKHLKSDLGLTVFDNTSLMKKLNRKAPIDDVARIHIASGIEKLTSFLEERPELTDKRKTLANSEIETAFKELTGKEKDKADLRMFKSFADFRGRSLAGQFEKAESAEAVTEEKIGYMTKNALRGFVEELENVDMGAKAPLKEAAEQIQTELTTRDKPPASPEETLDMVEGMRKNPLYKGGLKDLPETIVMNPYFGRVAQDLVKDLSHIEKEVAPTLQQALEKKQKIKTTQALLGSLSNKTESLLGLRVPSISELMLDGQRRNRRREQ